MISNYGCKSVKLFSPNFKRFCENQVKKESFFKRWDFKKFGKLGGGIYLCTSAGGFAFFYLMISNDIIKKEVILSYLQQHGYKIGEGKVNLALAYACLFASKPIRIVFTCLLAGYLTKKKSSNTQPRKGIIKRYGIKGFSIYMAYWIGTGFIFYYLIKYKYIDREKVESKIQGTMIENYYTKIKTKIGSNNVDIAVAYFINAIFEIVRLPTFILFMKYLIKKGKM